LDHRSYLPFLYYPNIIKIIKIIIVCILEDSFKLIKFNLTSSTSSALPCPHTLASGTILLSLTPRMSLYLRFAIVPYQEEFLHIPDHLHLLFIIFFVLYLIFFTKRASPFSLHCHSISLSISEDTPSFPANPLLSSYLFLPMCSSCHAFLSPISSFYINHSMYNLFLPLLYLLLLFLAFLVPFHFVHLRLHNLPIPHFFLPTL